jgi:hypothetical protein
MNIEIVALSDENFTLISDITPASTITGVNILGELAVVEPEIEVSIPEIVEVVPPTVQRGPQAVPLENHKSIGMGWFDGTSWGTTENKQGF